jgi:hypothetical protein
MIHLNNNIKWQSVQSTHPQNQSPISWVSLQISEGKSWMYLKTQTSKSHFLLLIQYIIYWKLPPPPRKKKERKEMKYLHRGICNIKYLICNKSYVGQIGRNLLLRFHEHISYIRTNNLAMCVCQVCSGPPTPLWKDTMELIISAQNGACMNCLESCLYTDVSTAGFINWRTKCRRMKSAAWHCTRHLTSMHVHVREMSYWSVVTCLQSHSVELILSWCTHSV